jgi:hypothetical protein
MDTKQWHLGIDPTRNLAKLGEMALRLSRLALYRKLQQAETQLNSMGLPNNISDVFLKSSEEVLKKEFRNPEFRCIRVDTTTNSVF